jgi:hypothetical protein
MVFNDEGTEVTLTLAEYGELKGRIGAVERLAAKSIAEAQFEAQKATALLNEALNKEELTRRLTNLLDGNARLADITAQVVRMSEHFMQEVYHTCANVSREHRTELEEKMKRLRG